MGRYAREFYEPWYTTRSKTLGPEPDPRDYPDDETWLNLHANWERLDGQRDAIIWGHRMVTPGPVRLASGAVVSSGDAGIIAVRRKLGLRQGKDAVTHVEIAERICACVNALAGVDDPKAALARIHAVMLAIQQCDSPEALAALKHEALLAWDAFSPKEHEPVPTW